MRKLLFLLVITLLTHVIQAQGKDKNAINKKHNFISIDIFKDWDILKRSSYVDSINNFARNNTRVDRNLSAVHAYHALDLSIGTKYKKGEAYAYRTIASLNLLNNNNFSAVEYIFKSISVFESLKDNEGIADANFTLGLIYKNLNKPEESLKSHQLAYEYFKNSEKKDRKGTAAYNLADSYFSVGDLELSKKYIEESIKIAKDIDFLILKANCYNLKSKILMVEDKNGEALTYINEVISISRRLGENSQKETFIQSLIAKAKIFKKNKDFDNQIIYLKEALVLSEKYVFKEYFTNIYIDLIDAFLKTNNLKEANFFLAEYNNYRQGLEKKIIDERFDNIFESLEKGFLAEQNEVLSNINQDREEKIEIITKTIIIGIYCLIAFLIGTIYTIRLLGKTKKNEAQLNAFYENAPLGIVFLDKDLRIIKINKTIQDFLFWKKEEIIGHYILDKLGINDNLSSTDAILEKYIEPVDFSLKGENKKSLDLKMNISKIDLNGVIFYIAFIEDKTLKISILRKNLELNELLNETYRIAGIGSYEITYSKENGFIINSFSEVAKEILGIRSLALTNSIFSKLISEVEFKKYNLLIKKHIDSNEYFDHELKISHLNGTPLFLRVIGKIITTESGEIEIKGIFQDVTQRKLLINQLENNLNKEKELNNLKSRFISMTSHEFKTPLSTINSSAELIEIHTGSLPDSNFKDKILTQIQKIYKQISRLGNMMNDILLLEKNQNNMVDYKPQKIKIGQFLTEFTQDFEPENDKRKLKVLLPEKDFSVFIDKNILFYILTNLATNAFKYSANAPEPTISLVKNEHKFKILVEDFGIGIPKEEKKFIFDSFFRGKNVATIKGTGLGLFIVKEFLEKINGEIKFSSQDGKGTIFELSFPIGVINKNLVNQN